MANGTTPGAFIPHDTAAPKRSSVDRGGLYDLIFLAAIVLLVASAALGGGVFLYAQFLQTESTSKLSQLQRAEAAFEPALIQQLTRLDDRMHAADVVLSGHIAPTTFFQALASSTLQTVEFKTLDYEEADPQHITIKMQGVAESVNSIALQADLFSKNGVITSPIFSNIARQLDGVHFDLVAKVNPAAVGYATYVNGQSAQSTDMQAPAQAPAGGSSPFDGSLQGGSSTPPAGSTGQ